MPKWIKYPLVTLCVLVLIIAAGAAKLLYIDDWLIKQSLGPRATTIEIDGNTFRDLNKNGELDVYEDSRESLERRIDDLIQQMTLAEKAGLMFQPPLAFDENGEVIERANFKMSTGLPLSQRWRHGITRFRSLQSAPGWVFR